MSRADPRVNPLFLALERMSAAIETRAVLQRFVDVAVDMVGAERAVLEIDDRGGRRSELIMATRDGDVDREPWTHGNAAENDERWHSLPVRLGNGPFGTLHLRSGDQRRLEREDIELAAGLANLAGNLIRSAILYQEIEVREQWGNASSRVSTALLAVDPHESLRTIAAELAAERKGERIAVLQPGPASGSIRVVAVEGPDRERCVGRTYSAGETLGASVLGDGMPRATGARTSHGPETLSLETDGMRGPVLFFAITRQKRVCAVLAAARQPGSPEISDTEVHAAADFAERMSLVLDLAVAREAHERSTDRARIARDLHDHVIQILFSVGLDLKNVLSRNSNVLEEALSASLIDRIDDAIRRIRTTIFSINPAPPESARQALMDLAEEASRLLPQPVNMNLSGPIDTMVTGSLLNDVTAVAREMLANVVRHSGADRVEMDVAVLDGSFVLTVEDDGVGMSATPPNGGLANMRKRALARGGSFEVSKKPRRTSATWVVPLP
ncbi:MULTISPECIES: ATP-binding protein [unclassified Salinibacterium]|uniref:ATP-binding protein n=1 Tax=unclassified Salinibacterium TaxID=2632331 RepID=UPI00143E02A6|nr:MULTISPECIES: ATP-binding protein [unclassified Salinibacterium]